MIPKLKAETWFAIITIIFISSGFALFMISDPVAPDEPVKVVNSDESISTSNIGVGEVYNIAGSNESVEFGLKEGYDSVVFEANIYYVNSTGLERGGFGGGSSSAIEEFESVELSINSSDNIADYNLRTNYAFAVIDSGVEIKSGEIADDYSEEPTDKANTGASLVFIGLLCFFVTIMYNPR